MRRTLGRISRRSPAIGPSRNPARCNQSIPSPGTRGHRTRGCAQSSGVFASTRIPSRRRERSGPPSDQPRHWLLESPGSLRCLGYSYPVARSACLVTDDHRLALVPWVLWKSGSLPGPGCCLLLARSAPLGTGGSWLARCFWLLSPPGSLVLVGYSQNLATSRTTSSAAPRSPAVPIAIPPAGASARPSFCCSPAAGSGSPAPSQQCAC